ncbi:MAG: zinc ABC transporter substrate-binding protein [Anaerolineales bacterium]|nr:zinc ABC transporter substrate-binding protein [Anaerolineales bacterium]
MSIHKSMVVLLIGLLLTGCGNASPAITREGLKVVASTTFLADIAQSVAGDRLQVESLLPIGADPHSYQPIPQDVARVANSNLLIINGAEYEHFLENVLENAGGERTVVEASAGLKVREEAGSEHGLDPHLWLDPNNVITFVENIQAGLIEVDPEGAEIYRLNAQGYVVQLQELDSWIRTQVGLIPVERRLLVTNHDSLGYFAERYGFTVIGTVVPGFSSDAAPSAQQMAALIDQIKASRAPAVFLDAAESTTLADQIASDAGVVVVTDLYFGSLTDGPPAGTYIDMMKHNITRIVEVLR